MDTIELRKGQGIGQLPVGLDEDKIFNLVDRSYHQTLVIQYAQIGLCNSSALSKAFIPALECLYCRNSTNPLDLQKSSFNHANRCSRITSRP
ncbi:hypothetical protein DID88_006374 [Monilinia fructigena]|uniref:Uncharacterized protein n=1 Tax=Monilinia fructigena TaxID=38457 RepID=A0A395J4V4_9HELO|nr:hypothetical protein DID88_006374 [Monilinia fructigena]